MTISKAILRKESFPIGVPSSPTTSSPAPIIYREFGAPRPLPLPNTVSLESITRKYEADPEKMKYLARAREKLSTTLYADEPETLSALRLAAGLSQAQLATRVATSQPYIARIERGQHDPSTDLIVRIAKALGLEEERVFRAIRYQIATRTLSE